MRVKVKKTRGVTGNQHNYGLVTGSIWNYEDQPTNNTVGTTLSPVPREDANIEAERGETIVFPDSDGDVAHAKIGGKRHSQGGTPLNVPDGSFVFSDFRGLLIKNKEVLKDIFNISGTKSKTPAEIAKKYEINSYKEILKDPWADPMDKKTAQLMIENNMKKLGQLALIQEGMKGFPDGIPDIALPLMGSDIAQGQPIQEEQGMPMARYGGLPKAQSGISGVWDYIVKTFTDPSNDTFFGQPIATKKAAKPGQNKTVVQNKPKPTAAAASTSAAKPKANTTASAAASRSTTSDENDKMHKRVVLQHLEKARQAWINAETDSAEEKAARQYLINILGENPEFAKLPAMQDFFRTIKNSTATSRPTYAKDFTKDLNKRKTVAEQRQADEDKRIGLVRSLPDEDEPLKRIQVEQANKIYNDALLSNDPEKMRAAATLLEEGDTFDISGLSTPLGMINVGARNFGNFLGAVGQGVLGGFGLPTPEWTDFTDRNVYGQSWQEKIYDMADLLQDKAKKIEGKNKFTSSVQSSKQKAIDFRNKYNIVKAAAEKVLYDPKATPEEKAKASLIYEDVTNSGIYNPFGFDNRGGLFGFESWSKSPYSQGQKWQNYSTIAGSSMADKYNKKLDTYLNDLKLNRSSKDAAAQIETSANTSASKYPQSEYFDAKGYNINGATWAVDKELDTPEKRSAIATELNANENFPLEKIINGRVVIFGRNSEGLLTAVYPPKDYKPKTIDTGDSTTQKDTSTVRNTGEVKTKDKKREDKTDDTYTTLDEALDLWNQATQQQQPQQKFGGQQEIISYDPVKRFEVGGQLNKFVGGGGKHTQLIKETAIKPTDEYEVVMPNKRLDYTFGKQSFDSTKNYYTAINKTTGKEEELDLNDFINRQTDVLKGYDGGIDKWKTDVLSTDKATREKAAGWFQENYNIWRKANGLPEYFITKSGPNPYGKDKKLGVYTWSAPGIKKKVKTDVVPPPANTPPPASNTPSQPGAIPPQNYEQGIAGTPWWNYDLVNYGSQLSNYFDINPGELPTFMNYLPYVPDPTFLDPARAIAQQQGVVRGTQEAMMSGSDPTVARANMIAASAGAAPQIANIMAQYDERNAGIANQYESSRAQILNQAQLQNQQFEKQYRDELEVRRQQYENALREGRTNVAKSIMQGLKNAAETSWVNATSDSYAVDPGTGQVYFKRGFDPLKGSFRSQTGSIADAYEELLNKGWSDEQARAILELQVKSKLPMNRSEAKYGGSMYNPMDLLWND